MLKLLKAVGILVVIRLCTSILLKKGKMALNMSINYYTFNTNQLYPKHKQIVKKKYCNENPKIFYI